MYFRNKNYRADVNGMLYKVSEERYYDDYVYKREFGIRKS